MTPMGTNYGETSGEMSNRHMTYYSLRAEGGVGLIILENANIEYPVGSNGTSQIRIDHDSFMPRYYQLVEYLHKNGATVAIQINHAGASASSARIISRIALIFSPSKNMCSVRQRPIPIAPKLRATAAS